MPLSPSEKITREYNRLWIISIARISLVFAICFILYEAAIPHPIPPPRMDLGDKVLHAAAFFTLTALTELSFPSSKFLLWKVLFLMGFGLFIEWLQSLLPWRSADASDFLADCIGIAAFLVPMLLTRFVLRFVKR
ncbi:VanZ family protein [Chlorobaculum sp. 24CR]|nr:VanZ family protein [Chlorobaculum sp. 24CR]